MDQYIMICLNQACMEDNRFIKGLNISSHVQCHQRLFGINALLQAAEKNIEGYPFSELGKLIKSHLYYSKSVNKSQLHLLKQTSRQNILKAFEQMFIQFQKAYPPLQNVYKDTYSLDSIKDIIKQYGKTDTLKATQKIKHILSLKKEREKEVGIIFNQIKSFQKYLENIVDSIRLIRTQIMPMNSQKQIQKFKEKLSPIHYATNKYKMQASTYVNSKNIKIVDDVIIFPDSNKGHFNPWVYGQQSFTQGCHIIKFRHQQISGNQMNCGVGILNQNDKNSFPFRIFKSLFDMISSQMDLVQGRQISEIIQSGMIINGVLDLQQGSFEISDQKRLSVYRYSGKTQLKKNRYRLCTVGISWKISILYLS